MSAAIVWFRQDLRLADNPALTAALQRGNPVICVYVWAPEEEGDWPPGACTKWWLHHSLTALDAELKSRGSRLIVRRGPTDKALRDLFSDTGADAVFWNRRYEPTARERDQQLKSKLKGQGLIAESFNGSLFFEPWEIQTQQSKPYHVFTPFWKACKSQWKAEDPLPAPSRLPAPDAKLSTLQVDDLKLLPQLGWADRFPDVWSPGERGAQQKLDSFLAKAIIEYKEDRNFPDRIGTSQLSPHLHFGEISPRQIEWTLRQSGLQMESSGVATFLSELGWREFAHHILYHFPDTTNQPLRASFREFPWSEDSRLLRAWQRGETGYPIVDAGMRELWTTGWMHNRVRMIVGSFLTKDLLIPWQAGARWFWDTLVDADLPNNSMGWQWISGCGADAAPYFRIFNPVSQGEKFDPSGNYVRRWCPELADLPAKWIHQPWAAPASVLNAAGIRLRKDYPEPCVDHAQARKAALACFAQIKG